MIAIDWIENTIIYEKTNILAFVSLITTPAPSTQREKKGGGMYNAIFFLTHTNCNQNVLKNRNENEMQRGMKNLQHLYSCFQNQLLLKTCSTICNQNLIKKY